MNTTEMKVIELTTYNFNVKLEYLDECKIEKTSDYYCVPFQVLAKDGFEAQRILEEWLSNPSQTGYKYKTWVGIRPLPSNSVLYKTWGGIRPLPSNSVLVQNEVKEQENG